MSNLNITPIAALSDNYIWCGHNDCSAFIVDPGEAQPVLEYLSKHNLTLSDILVTHHHWDHTNGIEALVKAFPDVKVYGPARGNIAHLTDTLGEGDKVSLRQYNLEFDIIEVPGHTLDHIAFVWEHGVFCGDTLFSAGCGRLFEGTPAQMHSSLAKLTALPDNTPVYCTHEYTLANLAFAKAAEPDNAERDAHEKRARDLRAQNLPTLPSSIKLEKAINPFLRAHKQSIKQQAEQRIDKPLNSAVEVFAAIRGWKDNF